MTHPTGPAGSGPVGGSGTGPGRKGDQRLIRILTALPIVLSAVLLVSWVVAR